MALLLTQKQSIYENLSFQRLTRKALKLKECMTPAININLNISIIYKTIKTYSPSRGTKITNEITKIKQKQLRSRSNRAGSLLYKEKPNQ